MPSALSFRANTNSTTFGVTRKLTNNFSLGDYEEVSQEAAEKKIRRILNDKCKIFCNDGNLRALNFVIKSTDLCNLPSRKTKTKNFFLFGKRIFS